MGESLIRINPPVTTTSIGAVAKGDLALNVKDYGAKGDGTTDDFPAIKAAVAAGSDVLIPAGTYYVKATSVAMSLPAGTRLRGVPGKTIINFDTDTAATYREFARNAGDGVTIEGITIYRVSDFPTVLFPLQGYSGFTLRNCTIIGNRDTYTTNYCHGIQVGAANASRIRIIDSTVKKCAYGLFMSVAATATVSDIVVDSCTFANQYNDDLEFNSPLGTISDVVVRSSTFSSNQQTASGSGFAVGFAHVLRGTVRDCYVTGYANEAIHIEDYSEDIVVDGNKFVSCGTSQGSYIQVISGAKNTRITNNTIDSRANANATSIYMLNVLAGGTGNTPGGRAVVAPSRVAIANNTLMGSNASFGGTTTATRGIYLESIVDASVSNNILLGAGSVTGSTYAGTLREAISIFDGRGVTLTGNTIDGWLYGLPPYTGTINPFGQGGVIANNVFRNCSIGLSALNIGSAVISGNMFHNCVKPLIAGSGSATGAYPVTITGNHAYACAEPMAIHGVSNIAVTSGAATQTVGTGKTVTVKNIDHYLPTGTVITFSGGGTLTLTSGATSQAVSLVGNVAGASIAANETASVPIAYSPVGAQNLRLLAANGDSNATGYGYRSTGGTSTTTSRPSATTVGVGTQFFDSTLGKPIWSDGTNWKDAAGTTV